MTAWVRFINLTEHKAIYIQADEIRIPVLLPHNQISKYIYFPAGSTNLSVFNLRGHLIKLYRLSVQPAVLQTIVLK